MSWKGSWGKEQASWGKEQQQWGASAGKGGKAAATPVSSIGVWGGKSGQQWGKDNAKGGKAAPAQQWGAEKAPAAKGKPQVVVPPTVTAGAKGAAKGAQGAAAGGWAAPGKGGSPQANSWAGAGSGAAVSVEKAKKLTQEFSILEASCSSLVNSSKALNENEKSTVQAIKSAILSLETQQNKLNEIQKSVSAGQAEAQKAGPAASAPAAELTQLLAKVKALWQSVSSLMAQLKPKVFKLENEGALKAKEAKDVATFKPILAKANAETVTALNVPTAVAKEAAPLLADAGEEGEERDAKIAAIEASAGEAIKKLDVAKNDLNEKMKTIQIYAPEAKKAANAALMDLTKKIADGLKMLHVYKHFKKNLPSLLESQKAIVEVTEKLSGHESAISKADQLAKAGKLTKEQVQEIDAQLDPVLLAVTTANSALNKCRNADAVTQANAAKLRTQGEELKKKVDAVIIKIKAQRDVVKAEEAIASAKDMFEKAAASWKGCQNAEMPFLMGVEVLPTDENAKAVEACTEAAQAAQVAISVAKGFFRTRLGEANGYEKELGQKTTAELSPLSKKVEELEGKFQKFRKELSERKIVPLLAEALSGVREFEGKAKAAEALGKTLAASDLEDKSAADITGLLETAQAALTEANKSLADARKVAKAKQNEAKAHNTHPTVNSINQGLQKGEAQLHSVRSLMEKAQLLVKAKSAVVDGDAKLKEAEADAQKAKKLVPAEGAKFSMDTVTALDEACAAVNKNVHEATKVIQGVMVSAPTKAKAELQKLLERKTAVLVAVNEVKTSTRDRSEAARSDSFVAEAEAKAKAVEEASAGAEKAEGPFLTGAELTLKATQELLAKCTEAASKVHAAMAESNKYNSAKLNEIKGFKEDGSKKVKEGLAAIGERLKKVALKLTTFEKDSKERAKESRMLDASEKVEDLEASVKKTVEAAAPFTKEGAESMTEDDAEAPLKVFMEVDQETLKKMASASSFVQSCAKEQAGNKAQTEVVKKLLERISTARDELATPKKATAPHEKKSLAKRLLAEAKEQVAGLDADVKKVTAACAALLEEGGEQFLISKSVATLVAALRAHMKEKEQTEEAIFKDLSKGKKVSEKDFVKYLAELPEAIGHDELNAFSAERRQQIFKSLASNGKTLSAEDFASMFHQKFYVCKGPVVLTNQFEVEGAETVCKVEQHEDVMLIGQAKDDAKGLSRSEAKVGDKSGWVTISGGDKGKGGGDKGKGKGKGKDKNVFLRQSNPFKKYCQDMDRAIHEANAAVQKVSKSLQAKSQQAASEEMTKLKEEAAKAQKTVNDFTGKVKNATKAFEQKVQLERNAHVEARNAKEAAPFVDGPKALMQALEADAKAAEEAGAPVATISGDDFRAFATPASVLEAVEKLAAAVKVKADAAREAIKEQTKAVTEVSPQNGGTSAAKNQLKTMANRCEELARKTTKAVGSLSNKCRSLINAKVEPCAEAIRKIAQEKSHSPEEHFDSLKKGEKIPEEAMCKLLASLELEGGALSAEHAKLLCRKLEADGISKESFMKLVVVYYKVAKVIAFTDNVDINACKTLRKAEEGEVIEVLEGPQTNAENGMTRIRGRACNAPLTEGWITVSGSQGTAFLVKTTKPPTPPAAKD